MAQAESFGLVNQLKGRTDTIEKHVDKSIVDLWTAIERLSTRINWLYAFAMGILGTSIGILFTQVLILLQHQAK